MSDQKKHFYMISGQVVYNAAGDEESLGVITVNALLRNENVNINRRSIGVAERELIETFSRKMNGAEVTVRDVVILGFHFLGHMTEEEFFPLADQEALKNQFKEEVQKALSTNKVS
jgi:hypothetical protein